MRWVEGVRSRLRGFFLRHQEEREMDEELAFHMELEVGRNLAAGMSPREARRRAVIAFGGVERYREAVRDERRVPVVHDAWLDFRNAWRTLARMPGYGAVIVLTLALGMGTSVAIHTVVRGLITDPIPVPAPERLIAVDRSTPRGVGYNPTYEDFLVWESEVEGLVDLGGFTYGGQSIGDGSATYHARAIRVTEKFFPALSLTPLLGRMLVPSDHDPASEPVAILGHRFWERELGADSGIVGRTVFLDGRPYAVVGVLPSGVEFPAGTDLWFPLRPDAGEAAGLYLNVIGRLRPDVGADEVRTALTTIQQGLEAGRPPEARTTAVAVGPWTGRWAEDAIQAAGMLYIAVLVLLLIGAANASGLMLTKGITRSREFAIRTSLGATRWRLGRQLLAESLVLATLAGALGLLVAHLTIRLVRLGPSETFAHENMLGWERLGLDGGSLVHALLLSGAVGMVFGTAPALRAAGRNLISGLGEGAPTITTDRGRSRALRFLLGGEVALALVLLTTSGLLTRSVLELVRLDPGHSAERLLTVRWMLSQPDAPGNDPIADFQDPLLERLGGIAGVEAAAITSNLPTTRLGSGSREYRTGPDPTAEASRAAWRSISPSYPQAIGIPLLAGRSIEPADREGYPPAALISESLARRHWAGPAEAIGERIRVGADEWTIVGVVGDVRNADRMLAPSIYVPQRQSPTSTGFLVARARGDPAALAPLLRAEIWRIDPAIAVGSVESVEGMLRDTYANDRTLALLVGIFAVLALAITIVSLYVLIVHSVTRRRREIGLRLALGAHPRHILRSAMWDGLFAVSVGTGIGGLLGFGVAGAMGGMVYGFNSRDPLVLVLATAGLLFVAAVASYLPARNAALTDPVVSLRAQ
jgi:putative ABC transport system permease protein